MRLWRMGARIGLAILAFSIGSCGTTPPPGPAGSGALRIYTSVPSTEIERIRRAYAEVRPGVSLEVVRAGTGELMKRMTAEAESGPIGADIAWVADFSSAEQLKQLGFLQPYTSPEAAGYFPFFRDADGFYTGSRLLHMVIVYNTSLVAQPPTGYRDLLRPELAGRIGVCAPGTSGASLFSTGTLLLDRDFGWEYFFGLRENRCRVVDGNDTLAAEVATGRLAMGIGIDFIARREMQGSPPPPIDYVSPRDGCIAVASPIAIGRDCANLVEARTFVDWILSERGQAFLARDLGISPVHPGVPHVPGTIPLSELRILPVDARRIAMNVPAINRIFNEIFSGRPVEEIDLQLKDSG